MAGKKRFTFIDEFRGLVGVMMALGHSNYYFNSAWLSLDPLDPFFDNTPQFLLRYMGYLCAPGFLMMNGAMVYYVFKRRLGNGEAVRTINWGLIQRGLFLVAVQVVWVNASWSGFAGLRLNHFGIIATIGMSMALLTLMARWNWKWRALTAGLLFLGHPLLLRIPYDMDGPAHYWMQLFIDSGHFTKYPLIPWFALAVVGSVMAHFWFEVWTDPRRRSRNTMITGLVLIGLAWCGVALGLTDPRDLIRSGLMTKDGGDIAMDHYFYQISRPNGGEAEDRTASSHSSSPLNTQNSSERRTS